ncbi:hypothetical protein [Sediminibacterium ginsengisoli]|uniref:hypothetical protein n=1 Tax=Sediminibacterium ginsengisoli TaxID=413434 RepID=UPI0011172583|nr:hypothetical protein [Sediminibacterium ginsengisoli]
MKGEAQNTDRLNTLTGSVLPAASAGGALKGAIKAIQDNKVDTGPSALGGSVGVIGGAVPTITGTMDLAKGIATKDTRRALNGGMDLVQGGLGIAGGAASIAGSAAVPGIGLASAAVDTARNAGNAVYTDSQKKKLETQFSRIASVGPGDVTLSELGKEGYKDKSMLEQYQMLQIAKRAAVVREKQRNRAIVNAVASGVETAGHATVVGAGATGVGAAVGAGLVAGGKGIKAGAGLTRYIKQTGKDKGWWGKGANSADTSAGKSHDAMTFIAHARQNYQNEEVQESLAAMGANEEQMALFRQDKLPVDQLYALYRKR